MTQPNQAKGEIVATFPALNRSGITKRALWALPADANAPTLRNGQPLRVSVRSINTSELMEDAQFACTAPDCGKTISSALGNWYVPMHRYPDFAYILFCAECGPAQILPCMRKTLCGGGALGKHMGPGSGNSMRCKFCVKYYNYRASHGVPSIALVESWMAEIPACDIADATPWKTLQTTTSSSTDGPKNKRKRNACSYCLKVIDDGGGIVKDRDGDPVPGVKAFSRVCQMCLDDGRKTFACLQCGESDVLKLVVVGGYLRQNCFTCETRASAARRDAAKDIDFLMQLRREQAHSQVKRKHYGYDFGYEWIFAELNKIKPMEREWEKLLSQKLLWHAGVFKDCATGELCNVEMQMVAHRGSPFSVHFNRIDDNDKRGYFGPYEAIPLFHGSLAKYNDEDFMAALSLRTAKWSRDEAVSYLNDAIDGALRPGTIRELVYHILSASGSLENGNRDFFKARLLLEAGLGKIVDDGEGRRVEWCRDALDVVAAYIVSRVIRAGGRDERTSLHLSVCKGGIWSAKISLDRKNNMDPYGRNTTQVVAWAYNLRPNFLGGANDNFPTELFALYTGAGPGTRIAAAIAEAILHNTNLLTEALAFHKDGVLIERLAARMP